MQDQREDIRAIMLWFVSHVGRQHRSSGGKESLVSSRPRISGGHVFPFCVPPEMLREETKGGLSGRRVLIVLQLATGSARSSQHFAHHKRLDWSMNALLDSQPRVERTMSTEITYLESSQEVTQSSATTHHVLDCRNIWRDSSTI